MNLQTIKSLDGKVEYVLLPFDAYKALREQITQQLQQTQDADDYEVFDAADYVDNPVALARIQAGLTQAELASALKVSQAYISKVENQQQVSVKVLNKVFQALESL